MRSRSPSPLLLLMFYAIKRDLIAYAITSILAIIIALAITISYTLALVAVLAVPNDHLLLVGAFEMQFPFHMFLIYLTKLWFPLEHRSYVSPLSYIRQWIMLLQTGKIIREEVDIECCRFPTGLSS